MMEIDYLPNGYYEQLKIISNVLFTAREIDVISCVTNSRGNSKIASILNIAPKTAETHIANITRKIEHNSRERIIDFIEKSGKISIVREHYKNLLVIADFDKKLTNIATLINNKIPDYTLQIFSNKNKDPVVLSIQTHLESAGIKLNICKNNKEIQDLESSKRHLICIISVFNYQDPLLLRILKNAENNHKLFIFVIVTNMDPSLISKVQYVDFTKQKNYYLSILEILKQICPSVNLDQIITQLKTYQASIIDSEDFIKNSPLIVHKIKEKSLAKKQLIVIVLVSFIIGIALLLTLLIYKKYYNSNNIIINFLLPNKKMLLERKAINNQLDQIFTKLGDINTVVLVGVGGSGKTTIARNYATKKRASIMWEINVETKNSLFLSLESLAYALSYNNINKQELYTILDARDFNNKIRLLLLFIQKQLKSINNWIIIYDNVQSLKDIFEYLPYATQSYSNGRIIITTRDATIKNSHLIDNLNVVDIGEINREEKLELFKNITNNSSLQLIHNQTTIEQFLDNIPSFPLDVSAAAHYLKLTNTSFDKYLENLKNVNLRFEKIQEKLQHEEGAYMETRYNIITKSLENITDNNQDFADLIAFVSLVGSQDIPRSLLDNYKNSTTVDDFIFNLKKYSFITNESSSVLGPTFSIHRDTQAIMLAYIKKKLNLNTNKEFLSQIANSLASYMNEILDQEDHIKSSILLDHYETFLSQDILTDEITGPIGAVLGGTYCFLEYSNLKTQQLLKKSLTSLEKYAKNTDTMALALAYLGITTGYLGDYKKCRNLLEQSIAIYNKNKSTPIGFAKAMTYLAHGYNLSGDYDKAKTLLQQSIKIYQKHERSQNITARAIRYLGGVYRELGEYEKARDLLEQSLALYTKDAQQIDIVFTMTYLGEIYKELGKYEKAKHLLEKGLIISEKYNTEKYNPYNACWIKAHLGIVYDKLGNYDKAKPLLEEAFEIYRKYYGEHHSYVAWMSVNLGNVHRELGEYEEAKNLLEHSLIIHKNNFHNEHVDIGWNLQYLGKLYSNIKEYQKAKNSLEQSLTIYKKHYGDYHIQTARALNALGENYLLEDELETAETLLNKSKNILELQQHPEVITSLALLGDLYSKKVIIAKNSNNIKKSSEYRIQSINYYKQGLEIAKTDLPPNSAHIVRFNQKIKALDT